jgi:hypothetical protein
MNIAIDIKYKIFLYIANLPLHQLMNSKISEAPKIKPTCKSQKWALDIFIERSRVQLRGPMGKANGRSAREMSSRYINA